MRSTTALRTLAVAAIVAGAMHLTAQNMTNPISQIRWNVMTGTGDPTATCQATAPPPINSAAPGQLYFDQAPPNAVSQCLLVGGTYKWVKNPVLPVFGSGAPASSCTASANGQVFVNRTVPVTYYICDGANATWLGPFNQTGPTGPMGPGACVVWRNTWTSNTAYVTSDCYNNGSNNYRVNTPYTSGATFGAIDTANTVIFGVSSSVGIAGLSSDSNNGTITAGGVQIGTHEYTITCKNTAADGIAIANAFTAGGPGTVVKLSGGTCFNTNQIINMQSYDTLDGQGATTFIFQPTVAPSPYTTGYLQNVASIAPALRTFTDTVTTAGSQIITSATAAFTSADAGRTITCNGVLGSGGTQVGIALPNRWANSIAFINSATSIQLVDPVPLTTSGTTCSIFARDSHITLKNMKIINNGPLCNTVAGSSWWIPVFSNINGLFLENLSFQDGTTGVSSTAGCKSIEIHNASNIRANNVGFATWITLQDGFDFFGNVSDVALNEIHGFTADDMIAVYASIEGFSPGFPQGPMHNFTVSNSDFSTAVSAVKLLGATGVSLPVTNVTIRDLHCRETYPNQATVGINNGLFLFEGTFDNLLIDGMTGYCQHVLTGSDHSYHLTIRNVSTDVPMSSVTKLISFGHSTASPNPAWGDVLIDGLVLNGNPAAGQNGTLINMDGTQSFNSFTIQNSSMTNYVGVASSPFNLSALSIGTLNFINNNWQFATGGAVTNPVRIGPASGTSTSMAVNAINIVHNTATIPAASSGPFPLYLLYNMANTVNVNVVDTIMMSPGASAAGTGFLIRNLNAPSVTLANANFNILNSAFINVTGCIQAGGNFGGLGSSVQAAGVITSGLNQASTCPANGQFNNPTLYGYNTNGTATHYDNVILAALPGVPNTTSGTTASTGGTLPDSTQYFYKWCTSNSVGYVCSAERTVTTGSTGTNTNTITIAASGNTTAATYTLARSTTTGAEQACTGYTNLQPFNAAAITDTGATCTGATMPATNTTLPIQTGLLKGNGPAPTLTWGTGAGATAPAGPTITGNQHSFNVQFFTTATPAASATLFTFPVSLPDSGCPTNVTFSAANAAIGAFIAGLNWSCAGSTITVTMGSSALTASTTYKLGATIVY